MAGVDVANKGGRRTMGADLNMVPFIDLLMVTLAFLLITAVWVTNARLNANAMVPNDPDAPVQTTLNDKTLHVHVGADAFSLIWKQGSTVVSETKVAREPNESGRTHYPALAEKIKEEWTRHGSHRAPEDRNVDQAVLHTENAAPFKDIVAVMDALYATKREFNSAGKPQRIPAMNLTFAVR